MNPCAKLSPAAALTVAPIAPAMPVTSTAPILRRLRSRYPLPVMLHLFRLVAEDEAPRRSATLLRQ